MTTKYKCLYEITGRIEDVNTFLVPLQELPKERKPLTWQRLQQLWIETPVEDAWIDRVWEFARAVELEHGIEDEL